jgi:uncharacterized protein (TIGR02421 family)
MTALTSLAPIATDCSLRTIRSLGDRLVRLLRPLRILDAIRWSREVEEAFFASRGERLPKVDRESYTHRPLGFDPTTSHRAITELEQQIARKLSYDHPAARLMLHRCQQGHAVIDLLLARGTSAFATLSAQLFGNSHDLDRSMLQLGKNANALLADHELRMEPRTLDAERCAHLLAERLSAYFGRSIEGSSTVKVLVTETLEADAAVGGDWIKIRRGARFHLRDVRLLEVHEGWVHMATSLNARLHPLGMILSRPLPASACTQEGLAVWTEILAFASHPRRLTLLAGRVEAVAMAEAGADFLEVYRFFLQRGLEEREAYRQSVRVFRGCLPDQGAFTKDLAYARGYAEVGRCLRDSLVNNRTKDLSLLFTGKVSVEDLPLIQELVEMGLLAPAHYIPPPYADARALAAILLCLLPPHAA